MQFGAVASWDNWGQILQIAESSIGADRCQLQLEGELDLWSVERLAAVR